MCIYIYKYIYISSNKWKMIYDSSWWTLRSIFSMRSHLLVQKSRCYRDESRWPSDSFPTKVLQEPRILRHVINEILYPWDSTALSKGDTARHPKWPTETWQKKWWSHRKLVATGEASHKFETNRRSHRHENNQPSLERSEMALPAGSTRAKIWGKNGHRSRLGRVMGSTIPSDGSEKWWIYGLPSWLIITNKIP